MNVHVVFCFIAFVASYAIAAPATSPATLPNAAAVQPLKPNLKWPDLASYQDRIKEPAVLLTSEHVLLFAPKRFEPQAKIIFTYLVKAYNELYKIVGEHTKYKIIVYHLPDGFGGTSECVIEYDYTNLDLAKSDEWKKHKVPHVSGYVEEMAHNFVSGTKAQFGWEMVGWSIGIKATTRLANNPIFARQVSETRQNQAKTFARYIAAGFVFPEDVPANLCDRIHAHLLYECEREYGEKFWPDFFHEVRAQRSALDAAVHLAGDDNIRNKRYEITVNCFDQLKGLRFKQLLERNGISTTVDAKSLHPTAPGWNRKFVPAD